MRRIAILALTLLFCVCAFSQVYLPVHVTVYGQHGDRSRWDSTIFIPTGCGIPTSLKSVDVHQSALYYDSCGHLMFVYDPSTTVWDTLAKGSGGVGGSVSGGGILSVDTSLHRLATVLNDSTSTLKSMKISIAGVEVIPTETSNQIIFDFPSIPSNIIDSVLAQPNHSISADRSMEIGIHKYEIYDSTLSGKFFSIFPTGHSSTFQSITPASGPSLGNYNSSGILAESDSDGNIRVGIYANHYLSSFDAVSSSVFYVDGKLNNAYMFNIGYVISTGGDTLSSRSYARSLITGLGALPSLTNGKFWIGDASDIATEKTPTGDVTFNNTGVFAIGTNKVINSMINSVAWSKITSTPTTISGYGITDAGTINSNIGSGYRFAVPGTNNIKTLFTNSTILPDSSSNTNGITLKVDTTIVSTKANVTDRLQTKQNTLKYGADFTSNSDSIFLKGDYLNIKDFGAIDDNSTDNTTAINAALTASAVSRKPVVMPGGGIFKISSSINMPVGSTLMGINRNLSQLRYTGTGRAIIGNDSVTIKNFTLIGNGKASGNPFETGICISNALTTRAVNCVIEGMVIMSFGGDPVANGGGAIFLVSIANANSEGLNIINCRILGNNAGINMASRSEYVNLTGTTSSNNTVAIALGTGNFAVTGGIFEGNTTNCKIYAGTNNGHGVFSASLFNHGTYLLDCQDVDIALGVTFSACNFYEGALFFKNANNIRFDNCNFGLIDSIHLDNSFVIQMANSQIGNTGTGGTIPINKFNGSTDIAMFGNVRISASTVNKWIWQITPDSVGFNGPIYHTGITAASSSSSDSVWVKDHTTNQFKLRAQSSVGSGGTVTSVTGTTNRITSSGGSTPAIDISSTFEALLGKVANRIDQNNASTTSAQLAGTISDETGAGPAVFGTGATLTGVIHAAGSTTAGTAPEYYTTSGASLLSSAVAGAREVDVNGIQYYTHATGERGVSLTEQFISLTSNYTLTSQTAAQQAFNSTTSGQITVASSKSYYIEGFFALSSLSASSGTFGFALGGTATFTSLGWFSNTVKPGAFTSNAGWVSSYNTTTANTSLVTANTSTFGMVWIRGIVRVNAGGTIIPEISLGVAAAAVVNANSWFKLIPVGTNTVTNVGNWN